MRRAVSAEHLLVNVPLGICVEMQWEQAASGLGKDAAFARRGRNSQPSAKTYFLSDAIEAESGDVHTVDALEGTITRFKRT